LAMKRIHEGEEGGAFFFEKENLGTGRARHMKTDGKTTDAGEKKRETRTLG